MFSQTKRQQGEYITIKLIIIFVLFFINSYCAIIKELNPILFRKTPYESTQ